ncbi:hypothetical protein ACF0H5_023963 [Mactra antiquata]
MSVIISFRQHKHKHFFTKWTKSDRFIVYMAFCDGFFNISHFLDHTHMAVTKDHVYPKALCEFYGFCLLWFIAAQMLLVNVVAINIFMLMYFDVNINFGQRDWRLLLYTFGVPFIASCVAVTTGQLGPFGIACCFDSVKGQLAVWFTTVPSILIIVVNIILYALTWKRIRHQTTVIKKWIPTTMTARNTQKTARRMSLFVVVFVLQWFPVSVHSLWNLIQPVHPIMLHIAVIFPNLGGCFNLAVCLLIRRSRKRERCKSNGLSELSGSKKQVNAISNFSLNDNFVLNISKL